MRVNFVTVFEGNDAKLAAADYEPRICAVREEYSVFSTAKLQTGYKVGMMCKINDIRKHTDRKELHRMLIPKWEDNECSDSKQGLLSDNAFPATEQTTERGDGDASDEELPWAEEGFDEENTFNNNKQQSHSLPDNNPSAHFITAAALNERIVEHSAPKPIVIAPIADDNPYLKAVPQIRYFFEKDPDELRRDVDAQELKKDIEVLKQQLVDAARRKRSRSSTVRSSGFILFLCIHCV